MKRALLVLTAILAVASLALTACGGNSGAGSASSAAPATAAGGVPATGMLSLGAFVPEGAIALDNGLATFGQAESGTGGPAVPAMMTSLGGKKWQLDKVGQTVRFGEGAVQLGDTRIIVGSTPAVGAPGKDQVPYAATSVNGGAFEVQELGGLFNGRSAVLHAASVTNDTNDPTTWAVAVGAVERDKGALVGNPTGTNPVAIISQDHGKTWYDTAPMPLPAGVTAAEAWDVTFSPHSTSYPGILVVGQGWGGVSAKNPKGTKTAIVWGSRDNGKTWRLISDNNFFEVGRDFEPRFIAADADNIIVAGSADVQGQQNSKRTPKQSESIEWVAGIDGVWSVIGDGRGLSPDRSSAITALAARPEGGFISASELFDSSGAPVSAGQPAKGHPVVRVYATADGRRWNNVNQSVPGIDSAAVVSGIAEFGSRDLLVGTDGQGHAQAWVIDQSTL